MPPRHRIRDIDRSTSWYRASRRAARRFPGSCAGAEAPNRRARHRSRRRWLAPRPPDLGPRTSDLGSHSSVRPGQLFTSPNRYLQSILCWWIGTVVAAVVEAVRVVRAVEVQIVDAAGRAIEIDVAAARIRLGAVGEIAERDEQPLHVGLVRLDERAERHRVSLQRERERSDAPHLPDLAS